MATAAFLSGLDIESGIKHLDPIHQKSIPSTGPSPSPLELDQLEWGVAYTGPSTPEALAGTINPIDQSSGIQSNLNSPAAIEDRDQVQTAQDQTEIAFAQRWSYFSNKWRVLTCCVLYLADGMSDSAPGALLPYMEKHYSIGYAVVSLIFVSQAAGFLAAAFITDTLKTRLGLAKTYSLSQFVMVTAFAMIIATPPFPVVVFSFFLNGWAMSINIALSNVFCANLANSTVILAAAQGAYGIGGTIGPIIATSLVSRGVIWSRYYIITLITCVFGAVASGWSFRYYETEYGVHLTSTLEREAGRQVEVNASRSSKRSLLIQALKYGVTLIGALFTFGYQGAEVS
jgi:fucose permease